MKTVEGQIIEEKDIINGPKNPEQPKKECKTCKQSGLTNLIDPSLDSFDQPIR